MKTAPCKRGAENDTSISPASIILPGSMGMISAAALKILPQHPDYFFIVHPATNFVNEFLTQIKKFKNLEKCRFLCEIGHFLKN